MKSLLSAVLLAGLIGSGCESGPAVQRVEARGSKTTSISSPGFAGHEVPDSKAAIVTPANVLTARVVTYNEAGRFVVLGFPVGQMPVSDQVLAIHRGGRKVGEVKVTSFRTDQNVVADLMSGEALPGDDVREP